jgi:sodium/hydrogen antiporter
VIILDSASLPGVDTILLATFSTVALSVFAHGLSARPLTNRYVRWYERSLEAVGMESVPAQAQRWRRDG